MILRSGTLANVRRPGAIFLFFSCLAVVYAAAANIRTVVDTDIGWQMATGRYMVEHGKIPGTDFLSYTAPGQEWIYPPFSGLVFHALHRIGGFEALTALGIAACVATLVLVLHGGTGFTAALGFIAVPLFGLGTLPRASLFTTVLFAAVFTLLWRHYRAPSAPLWLLPLLLCAWANLHVGFIAGLLALAGYAATELLELPFAARRPEALARLRRAAPYLAAAATATLVNPWGVRLYEAIARQRALQAVHDQFVTEWAATAFEPRLAFEWRSPASAYWWLLAAAVAGIAAAAWRRQPGPAMLLAGAAALSLRYVRFQPLFAVVTVVVAGALLSEAACPVLAWFQARRRRQVVAAAAAVVTLLAAVRVTDLITNRYYLSSGEIAVFGTGATRWYPERAAAFLQRERLPGRVFNGFNIGGYLAWRLGTQYPVYIDGRAVPYGRELFFRNGYLLQLPPDSPEWLAEADLRGIHTVILSVARYAGNAGTARQFCNSRAWRAVYLDEVSAVFLRNRAENRPWLGRFALDCATARFTPPQTGGRGVLYNFYADAGWVLHALGREEEALASLDHAAQIFAADQHLHLTRGAVLQAAGRRAEAERAFEAALRLGDNANARYALGVVQANQGRYAEAVSNIAPAARRSGSAEMFRTLGEVYLAAKQPREALPAFDEAERRSPYRGAGAGMGLEFRTQLAIGRAHAWFALGDLDRALEFQLEAVRLAAHEPARWLELAELYDARGQADRAREARLRAQALQEQDR